jgi:hypothetical protein
MLQAVQTELRFIARGVALLLLAACGGKVVFATDGNGGAGGAATVTSSVGTSSGSSKTCTKSSDCQSGWVCIHADGLCGKGAKLGTCIEQVAHPCPLLPPACFCDGTVSGSCVAADVSKDPTLCSHGTFSCGSAQCKKYLEYCHESAIGPSGGGPFLTCQLAPTTCSNGLIDCNCLQETNGTCTDDGDGGVHLSTP